MSIIETIEIGLFMAAALAGILVSVAHMLGYVPPRLLRRLESISGAIKGDLESIASTLEGKIGSLLEAKASEAYDTLHTELDQLGEGAFQALDQRLGDAYARADVFLEQKVMPVIMYAISERMKGLSVKGVQARHDKAAMIEQGRQMLAAKLPGPMGMLAGQIPDEMIEKGLQYLPQAQQFMGAGGLAGTSSPSSRPANRRR